MWTINTKVVFRHDFTELSLPVLTIFSSLSFYTGIFGDWSPVLPAPVRSLGQLLMMGYLLVESPWQTHSLYAQN